tara:strand:- start:120 stop:884 length:765 start_codon:yes stop_codon:yes gene_type:complete
MTKTTGIPEHNAIRWACRAAVATAIVLSAWAALKFGGRDIDTAIARAFFTVTGQFCVAWFVLSMAFKRQDRQFTHETKKENKSALQERYAAWSASASRFLEQTAVRQAKMNLPTGQEPMSTPTDPLQEIDEMAADRGVSGELRAQYDLLLMYETDRDMVEYIESASNWIHRARQHPDERYDQLNLASEEIAHNLRAVAPLIKTDTAASYEAGFGKETADQLSSVSSSILGVAEAARNAVLRERRRRWHESKDVG